MEGQKSKNLLLLMIKSLRRLVNFEYFHHYKQSKIKKPMGHSQAFVQTCRFLVPSLSTDHLTMSEAIYGQFILRNYQRTFSTIML